MEKYYWKSEDGHLTPVHELTDLHICHIVMKFGKDNLPDMGHAVIVDRFNELNKKYKFFKVVKEIDMQLSKREIEWLQLAIEDNNKYHIAVDNDCISIDECVDEENDEWDSVFVFDNYGQDLIVQLFNYIGCNADRV